MPPLLDYHKAKPTIKQGFLITNLISMIVQKQQMS